MKLAGPRAWHAVPPFRKWIDSFFVVQDRNAATINGQ
jgi:hypothetical protein